MASLIAIAAHDAAQTFSARLYPRKRRDCRSPTDGILPSCTSLASRTAYDAVAELLMIKLPSLSTWSTMFQRHCISPSLLKNMFQFCKIFPSAAHARTVAMFSGIIGSTQFCSTLVIMRVSTDLSHVFTIPMPNPPTLAAISINSTVWMKPFERCRISEPRVIPATSVSSVEMMAFTKVLVSPGRWKICSKSPCTSRWSC
mmetsp:Transcript_113300/g.331146  ORF Transcript_113300/g.331146 Transcript_113300/m.331146 type:complete len:200 (+) Transcript_113300:381-980(+)